MDVMSGFLQGAVPGEAAGRKLATTFAAFKGRAAERAREGWYQLRLQWCKFAHEDDWWPYKGRVVCKECGLTRSVPF